MKVFSAILVFSFLIVGFCKPKEMPFSENDTQLVSSLFQEYQSIHEGLLKNPPTLSTDRLRQTVEKLSMSTNPRLLEWKERLMVIIPKNSNDIEGSYENLSKFSQLLVEIKKEIPLKDEYHQFYCPMVEKFWLAKDKSVRNPYAPEMRDCGELVP